MSRLVGCVRGAFRALFVLSILVGAVLAGPLPVAEAQGPGANGPIVVDTTADDADLDGADGVCRTGAGACSLRAAIAQANYNIGPDQIRFDIGNGGRQRISLASALPSIDDPTGGVTIDGYSQPGSSPNTAAHGSNAVIGIEVDGPSASSAIVIQSAGNTIRGLAVYGSEINISLIHDDADGNRIVGNFIGTDADARYQYNGPGDGIRLDLGPDRNVIGTPDPADRNVVSGNGGRGIRINHGGTSQNVIQNNIIGLRPSGDDHLDQSIGVDIQWWSWGNLVGGYGPGEGNVVSGNQGGGGIDLSHMTTENLVIGNLVGTTVDGERATPDTANTKGLLLKDNPEGNYFAENIVAGNEEAGIWHKHNYTGSNAFVNNRIGVSATGRDLGTGGDGMLLRGHDDVYHGNIFANSGGETVLVSNTSVRSGHESWPDEQTRRNSIRLGTYYGNDEVPITFGQTCCPHPDSETPTITGLGPGEVYGGSTCAGCEVEVYVSGTVNGDGTLSPGDGSTGLTAIGSVTAAGDGRYSMASPLINPGTRVSVVATTTDGEVSQFAPTTTVPTDGYGLIGNPDAPNPPPAPPPAPPMPPPYVPITFECSVDGSVLSWSDAGAAEYYVFAVSGGVETYLGGHSGTSLTVSGAEGYRVEHWLTGAATNALCDGPGGPSFECSVDGSVLSWSDAGAAEYYVFAVSGGVETYLGGHSGTTLTVSGAEGYRVEHWLTGNATNALCDGGGGAATFECSVDGSVLSWSDAGAAEYYVFAVSGGVETYLGGHSGTTLTVSGAEGYRVEHWLTGNATNALCSG